MLIAILINCMFISSPLFAFDTNDTVSIQLKWFHQFQFAGYYAAIEKGFYAQEGLHVILKEINRQKNHVQSVVDGDAEYGVADAGLILDRMLGKPVVLLKQIFQHSPMVFASLKSSDIISPFDMNGKVVMLDIEGHSTTPLIALLMETLGGIDSLTNYWEDFNIDHFISGKVDVMSVYVTEFPFTMHKKNMPINIINPQNYGIDFYGDNFFTIDNEIKTNPERVEKMIRATIKGWHYALQHKDEMIDIIQNIYNPNLCTNKLQYEAKMVDLMILSEITPLGSVNGNRFKKVTDLYKKTGITISDDNLQYFIYEKTHSQPLTSDLYLTKSEKQWIKEHPLIRVASCNSLAPVEFLDEDGEYKGISIDYLHRIENIVGIVFIIQKNMSGALSQDLIKKGELDMLTAVTETKALKKYVSYTRPYLKLPSAIFTLDYIDDILKPKHLYQKKVAVDSMAIESYLKNNYPGIHIIKVDTVSEALKQLEYKSVLAYVGSTFVASHYIKKAGYNNIKISGFLDCKSNITMAVRKDWPVLLGILQKGLNIIEKNEHKDIFKSWVPVNYNETVDYSLIWQILFFCGVVFILFTVWNRMLCKEVNDRKKAEQEAKNAQLSMIHYMEDLKAAKEKAEASAQARSSFLANISHEIRTPMNAVLGFINVVLDRKDILPEISDLLKMAKLSALSLMTLINEIIDLSKAESGNLTISNKAFLIKDVIQSVLDTMSDKAHKKGLHVFHNIDNDLPICVLGDAYRFKQILINLIDNAIKFTIKGNVTINIERSEKPDFIMVSVHDTGIGIENDKINTIFDPFVQCDLSITKNYSGAGLGTTIVKHLVELMGGTIDVQSILGKGSCFYFTVYLPETDFVPEKMSNDEENKSKQIFKILLAEDSIELATLAIDHLNNDGHMVDHVWTGIEAIAKLKQMRYDIVLMNHQMPLMNGVETIKQIRHMISKKLPVIVLTNRMDQDEKQMYLEAGVNEVVSKPIHFEELLQLMKTYIPSKSENTFPEIEGVDFNEAMERIGDLDFIIQELLNFSVDYATIPNEIEQALHNNDLTKAYEIVHRTKGISGNLSITSVYQLVSELCTQIRNNDIETAKSSLPLLNTTLTSTIDAIKKLTETMPQKSPKKRLTQKSDIETCSNQLNDMKHALNNYDIDHVEQIFETLAHYFEDDRISKLSKKISDYDYEGALAEAQQLLDFINKL